MANMKHKPIKEMKAPVKSRDHKLGGQGSKPIERQASSHLTSKVQTNLPILGILKCRDKCIIRQPTYATEFCLSVCLITPLSVYDNLECCKKAEHACMKSNKNNFLTESNTILCHYSISLRLHAVKTVTSYFNA